MASIKKLSKDKWQATVFIGRDANGKQLKKKKTFSTEKEAKAFARELEQEIEERKYINIDNIRLSVWMDKWLELNENRLSPSTFVSYQMYVDTHFKPALGSLKLNQINEIHIKQYMNDKLKDLSSTTVRKHMLILRKILYEALKHKSPCNDIELPKKEEYKPRVPTEKEFNEIHEAVKGTRDEPIVLLAGWCGLRRGEIFALKWNDIDWNNKTIRIDEARAISKDGFVDKKPKSKKGLRTIAVPEYLIQLLDKQRKSQKQINKRIFNIRPDNYSSYFASIIKKKKLPNIRFHDLRHYHASWLYKQGIPDHYAAQRLGHDINVLKGIYQHLDMDVKTEIDNLIKANFKEQKQEEKKGVK